MWSMAVFFVNTVVFEPFLLGSHCFHKLLNRSSVCIEAEEVAPFSLEKGYRYICSFELRPVSSNTKRSLPSKGCIHLENV